MNELNKSILGKVNVRKSSLGYVIGRQWTQRLLTDSAVRNQEKKCH